MPKEGSWGSKKSIRTVNSEVRKILIAQAVLFLKRFPVIDQFLLTLSVPDSNVSQNRGRHKTIFNTLTAGEKRRKSSRYNFGNISCKSQVHEGPGAAVL
jgi:hypothetical protein